MGEITYAAFLFGGGVVVGFFIPILYGLNVTVVTHHYLESEEIPEEEIKDEVN